MSAMPMPSYGVSTLGSFVAPAPVAAPTYSAPMTYGGMPMGGFGSYGGMSAMPMPSYGASTLGSFVAPAPVAAPTYSAPMTSSIAAPVTSSIAAPVTTSY